MQSSSSPMPSISSRGIAENSVFLKKRSLIYSFSQIFHRCPSKKYPAMSSNNGIKGVSPCYFFKSQLLEYAQKVGFPKPVYETIKGGPPNRPSFRSTVILNDVRYDSLPGFPNRKAAEQSAAEVALKELANRGELNERISQPHETGLCKNVLQGYALKMKYGTPSYNCQMEEKRGVAVFSCTVEVGGSKFIGSAARTKKEAEISAARIALSAIQASVSGPSDAGTSAYTVVPRKKRATGSGISTQETVLKPKKVSLKKKQRRKRQRGREGTNLNVGGMGNSDASIDHVGGAAEDGTLTAREFYGGSSQS
ncbi:double-stranded RNA-binding protein 1-like isoform X3 [Diospyros lotus]|nr:double-stranded RNA-binding protein 1-like isoform X3 [Diospyros lotus]XP_052188175.1 double-stranded RNA-binding protein 1-like isoform X3 [Diospyros lotus]XP_052188176.1 double-stranded RNA-binding protein 1-like isoform X3 [Diospyros lotus]